MIDQANGSGTEPNRGEFLVVGIGASAGGVSALRQFFSHVPANSGMAFAVVLCLPPQRESTWASELQGEIAVPVKQVTETVKMEPNHLYVIPPRKYVGITDGNIRLAEPEGAGGGDSSIDLLFRTLADAYGKNAAAVLFSGTGADGTLGLRRIKENGGFVIVQDPAEAEYPDMPRSAIDSSLADVVLPVAKMPDKLLALHDGLQRWELSPEAAESSPAELDEGTLREVLTLLRMRTGNDFSQYKRPMLWRRIARRMHLREVDNMLAYLNFLQGYPEEVSALQRDLLITVTNFFRDPDSFEFLKKEIIPKLFAGKGPNDRVRVWSAGCATGEEAYSIAILLAEYAARLADPPAFQVFASDMDQRAIAEARHCRYPAAVRLDVSPDRLRRFFVNDGDRYRIKRDLRDVVVFAPHNILRDPPFSRLDLISCRNLLIYLNRAMQERVLAIFHSALRPEGYLFLGPSESAETVSPCFPPVDKKRRVYSHRPAIRSGPPPPNLLMGKLQAQMPEPSSAENGDWLSAGRLHQQVVELIAPPSVLINDDYDIVHISAHAGRYLRVCGGEPTRNLLKLAHPELRLDLHMALLEAIAEHHGAFTASRRLSVNLDGQTHSLNLTVRPVLECPEAACGGFLVILDETADTAGPQSFGAEGGGLELVRQLQLELQRTKDEVRGSIELYETSAEELRSSNEELYAINEELRSATEELETGKEELESVNEELTSVNHEYRDKIEELGCANTDLKNLMASTDIATIFLDAALRIKFYTPRAQELFNITSADIARPLEHFTHKLDYGSLTKDVEEVLRSFQLIEREVRTNDDSWYLARLTPYRTLENKIDGVALSFVDITTRVRNEEQLHRQAAQLREQAAALREGDRNKDQFLAMLAHELRNPLGAMLNSIDLLDHLGSSDDASARARGVIQRQGHHLVRLVDDLLDIERLRRGKIVLHKTRIELRAVVCAALEVCGPEIAANTHELNLSLPPDPIFLDGDLTRLAQVLTNLLNNALKYTPAGGRIDLIAQCAGSEVVIHLRDTGIGMEPAILPHLFEMYAQGDPLSGPAQKGLGVGLALVQQLVKMHGGTVEAASEGTGKGSEFIVRLPIAAAPAAQQNTAMTPVREDGAVSSPPKKKVMILDDNRDAADALALLLQTEGHEVRAVYNAQAALETVSQFQPEVAILDIGMPDMNGFEVAARVRESLPPIVLIALSGWALGRNDSRIRTAGFDSCFTKPVGAGKLNKLFEEVSKRGGIMTPSRVS